MLHPVRILRERRVLFFFSLPQSYLEKKPTTTITSPLPHLSSCCSTCPLSSPRRAAITTVVQSRHHHCGASVPSPLFLASVWYGFYCWFWLFFPFSCLNHYRSNADYMVFGGVLEILFWVLIFVVSFFGHADCYALGVRYFLACLMRWRLLWFFCMDVGVRYFTLIASICLLCCLIACYVVFILLWCCCGFVCHYAVWLPSPRMVLCSYYL